ncbi:heparinase II/III family protein [Shimia thalassica]|uniref:heparinase II/III family protein n=1 Tax=Shimia thalassica TaxID=1715693 RepID=UPI0026E16DD4|nr:heparinase II/III family protein [Shimia thalassica]MDO6478949.1 heparinase II/III family protein [Shimia thalassica]MDO6484329.1 heparinase II/III family protein [Shimia thalassica]MDO6522040.1 heparinase II/III family protein [Shimia thalassica]MDP2493658.1 heparinase II/III family protein [Shimia thalassica]MDP2578829.1 heparinase II/III family protein [Shimia thalassica]
MSFSDGLSARHTRLMHRLHARWSAMARPATAFTSTPEPRTIGSFARGRQLVAGNFLFAGTLVSEPQASIWDVGQGNAAFESELHGFAWLDDLAAVGDMPSREKAQRWVWQWIDSYGRGQGAGWTPDLTGRRLIRWINHALLLLRGRDSRASEDFYRSLGQQTIFLSRRWHKALPGLPRFEALTGLIYAGLALEGMAQHVELACKALEKECKTQVDMQGGIPTRNPEELLEVFTLLTWAASALTEAERTVSPEHVAAIERIAPTLRTLRHSDGGLARFHGGGRGIEGRLDHALAESHVKTFQADGLAMGYARLAAGRTSIVVDASPPATGAASFNAHASTLAFELTSGRRPLIVNCGSGETFGLEWRRAGRATPSHSTLSLDGRSSARLGNSRERFGEIEEPLVNAPKEVPIEMGQAPDGLRLQAGHDGFVAGYGITHARTLELTFDGRGLVGEDLLVTLEDTAKRQFDKRMDANSLQGIPFDVRFHIHPDADVALDMGGTAVSIALKSGEIWVFRHDSPAEMTVEPSVYLEKTRLKPRATKQVVLSGVAIEYATRIRWSLAKAQDSAVAIRDLNRDEPDMTN